VKPEPTFRGRPAEAIAADAARTFANRFGRSAEWLAVAPGRVNLIGDHTDYNEGFVLPMAIDRLTAVASAPAAGDRPRVYSAALDAWEDLHDLSRPRGPAPWSSYVRGVFAGFRGRGVTLPPIDVAVVSEVPLGAGLSSSAALEVATATLLEGVSRLRLDPVDKARLCQTAEHEHAGVPCGLMDQLASALGDERGALLVDCRSAAVRVVPLGDGARILVCNTNVRHVLSDGGYARRRAECDDAVARLGVKSLRDVDARAIDSGRAALGALLERRARHVVSENARTLEAAAAFERGDLATVGRLLYESHASLRDDYQVSCAELDAVVDAARALGPSRGVLGARMTGGGFGGCALVLIEGGSPIDVARDLERSFAERTAGRLDTFLSRPARGARLLSPETLGELR
jgi:galactokinase